MNKENFIKGLKSYKNYVDHLDALEELGVDLCEGPISYAIDTIFDLWCDEFLNEEGVDLIYWWLFEDVEKEIRDLHDNVVATLENEEVLYDYLNNNGYFKNTGNS